MEKNCESCSGPCKKDRVEIMKGIYMTNIQMILCQENRYFMWKQKEEIESELFDI